mmetsp:Transcript_56810/g.133144  ORF Transcript_56810/g.133144 Transcript_56810/m.133144 type:complete len:351 (-) Transcript_56810:1297-2349(-)
MLRERAPPVVGHDNGPKDPQDGSVRRLDAEVVVTSLHDLKPAVELGRHKLPAATGGRLHVVWDDVVEKQRHVVVVEGQRIDGGEGESVVGGEGRDTAGGRGKLPHVHAVHAVALDGEVAVGLVAEALGGAGGEVCAAQLALEGAGAAHGARVAYGAPEVVVRQRHPDVAGVASARADVSQPALRGGACGALHARRCGSAERRRARADVLRRFVKVVHHAQAVVDVVAPFRGPDAIRGGSCRARLAHVVRSVGVEGSGARVAAYGSPLRYMRGSRVVAAHHTRLAQAVSAAAGGQSSRRSADRAGLAHVILAVGVRGFVAARHALAAREAVEVSATRAGIVVVAGCVGRTR